MGKEFSCGCASSSLLPFTYSIPDPGGLLASQHIKHCAGSGACPPPSNVFSYIRLWFLRLPCKHQRRDFWVLKMAEEVREDGQSQLSMCENALRTPDRDTSLCSDWWWMQGLTAAQGAENNGWGFISKQNIYTIPSMTQRTSWMNGQKERESWK